MLSAPKSHHLWRDHTGTDGLPTLPPGQTLATRFPLLSCVARAYLPLPAGEALVERVSAIGGLIARARRARLKPERIAQLIYLRRNLVMYVLGPVDAILGVYRSQPRFLLPVHLAVVALRVWDAGW